MEQQKRRPWRRWVVLALMIFGCILGGGLAGLGVAGVPAARPEITVAPEKLLSEPLFVLPILGPVYLVNTMPTLAVTIILLVVAAYFTHRALERSRKADLVPQGFGNLMEAYFELLFNLTESATGAKWAPMVFPWFATIMTYVLVANLLKLIPGFESVGLVEASSPGHPIQQLGALANILPAEIENGFKLIPFVRGVSLDLNFTFALAIISVVMTQVVGLRAQGLGYFGKFLNVRNLFKVPFFGAMDVLVGLLELISEFAKILSFSFRLFFNMFGGIILVAVVASLLGLITIVPSMLYMFEVFVAVIQAFVFGMLTMVFMSMATRGHGGEEEHEAAPAGAREI